MIDLKEYDNRLALHDWYHCWSDDHGVWVRGEDSWREITYLSKESPEHDRLFDAWSKHHFTGKPWNTEHFTREQLDAVRQELGVSA